MAKKKAKAKTQTAKKTSKKKEPKVPKPKKIENAKLPINIPFKVSENEGECLIKISLTMNYCNKSKGTCSIEFIKWQIPVQIEKNGGDNRLAIEYKVTPKSQ